MTERTPAALLEVPGIDSDSDEDIGAAMLIVKEEPLAAAQKVLDDNVAPKKLFKALSPTMAGAAATHVAEGNDAAVSDKSIACGAYKRKAAMQAPATPPVAEGSAEVVHIRARVPRSTRDNI